MTSWNQRLSRPIVLTSGRTLATLRDAATCLQSEFATVRRNVMLTSALEDLLTAAESGRAADRATATDQVERVLADRGLTGLRADHAAPRSDLEARIRGVLSGKRLPKPPKKLPKKLRRERDE